MSAFNRVQKLLSPSLSYDMFYVVLVLKHVQKKSPYDLFFVQPPSQSLIFSLLDRYRSIWTTKDHQTTLPSRIAAVVAKWMLFAISVVYEKLCPKMVRALIRLSGCVTVCEFVRLNSLVSIEEEHTANTTKTSAQPNQPTLCSSLLAGRLFSQKCWLWASLPKALHHHTKVLTAEGSAPPNERASQLHTDDCCLEIWMDGGADPEPARGVRARRLFGWPKCFAHHATLIYRTTKRLSGAEGLWVWGQDFDPTKQRTKVAGLRLNFTVQIHCVGVLVSACGLNCKFFLYFHEFGLSIFPIHSGRLHSLRV